MLLFSPEQEEKRLHARLFAEKTLNYQNRTGKQRQDFKEIWQKCADFGLLGLPFPEEYEGLDQDIPDIIAIMEGVGLGSQEIGILFSVNAHIWACLMPIFTFGTEAQKEKYLPALIGGELIGAHGASEEEAGSDIWNLQTNYVETEDGYLLNGVKSFVTNAPHADLFLIFARRKGASGKQKFSCFIMERNTANLTVGKPVDKMGLEFSPMASVYMDDCFVPKENLLGKEHQATKIFNHSMEYERTFIFTFQIGLMEGLLNKCVDYAKKRSQFDQKIIGFQSVSNKLANMKVRLETSKGLSYKVAYEKSQNMNTYLSSSIAKLHISESLVQSSMDAIEIHGGYGYAKECGIEIYLRDFMASKIYSGTNDMQRNIIAKLI